MLTRIGLGAVLAMVSAAGAGAQDAAPEGTGQTAGWESVRTGDPVYVTDSRSQRRKGNIETVSDQDLTLKAGNRSWTVARADVQRIERQDPLWNGMGYGIAAAAAPLAVACLATGGNAGECAYVLGYAAPLIAVGAGAGALVDALRHKTVYWQDHDIEARIAPVVSRKSLGAALSLTW